MKKDIPFVAVEGVYVAVVQGNQADWRVYLINRNASTITNIFVTSRGYDQAGKDQQQTSVLRHYFTELAPGESALIEPIMPDLFRLNNEYLVSYFIDGQIFDKKFVFVLDSITEANLIEIKELNLLGILHQ